MSNARIEKLFTKIKNASDKLDALYIERRQTIEQLSDCYAKVNELNEKKNNVLALLNSVKRDLNNYYERVKTYQNWKDKQTSYESQKIADKNISIFEQNIFNLKSKKASYEADITKIQSELDYLFSQIKELNIRKYSILDEIKTLKQKKNEYKNSIDNIKAKNKFKR